MKSVFEHKLIALKLSTKPQGTILTTVLASSGKHGAYANLTRVKIVLSLFQRNARVIFITLWEMINFPNKNEFFR